MGESYKCITIKTQALKCRQMCPNVAYILYVGATLFVHKECAFSLSFINMM